MNKTNIKRVLVVGATGSVGREVVATLKQYNLTPIALVRNIERGKILFPDIELVLGDLFDIESLKHAVANIDAIIFTHGSNGDNGAKELDYGGVANIFRALNGKRPRIALMTSIYVTQRTGQWLELKDWKRRSERLVRASGSIYTIVRPSWFDHIRKGDNRIELGQGDTLDGGIARCQIAEVLVNSLLTDTASGKTFELRAVPGNNPEDWSALFAPLEHDNGIDGALDAQNMPLSDEPDFVQHDLAELQKQRT